MQQNDVSGVCVDRCGACGGVWLDRTELEAILKSGSVSMVDVTTSSKQSVKDDGKAVVRLCPHDHHRLITLVALKQSHIAYEMCQSCGGVFFDAGELRDLSDFTLIERVRNMLGK